MSNAMGVAERLLALEEDMAAVQEQMTTTLRMVDEIRQAQGKPDAPSEAGLERLSTALNSRLAAILSASRLHVA